MWSYYFSNLLQANTSPKQALEAGPNGVNKVWLDYFQMKFYNVATTYRLWIRPFYHNSPLVYYFTKTQGLQRCRQSHLGRDSTRCRVPTQVTGRASSTSWRPRIYHRHGTARLSANIPPHLLTLRQHDQFLALKVSRNHSQNSATRNNCE